MKKKVMTSNKNISLYYHDESSYKILNVKVEIYSEYVIIGFGGIWNRIDSVLQRGF